MTFLIAFSRSKECHAESIAHLSNSGEGRTALEAYGEHVCVSWQPQYCSTASLVVGGSRFVGIGRCRLDRKNTLIEHLQRQGSNVPADASDLLLATLAYTLWGEASLDYLYGDFALAIWDEEKGKIFLARDRLGVHNLAYLHTASRTWISNSVDALAAVPDLDPSQLDGVWIANFLGKITPDANSRSVFAQLRRLPPAHRAIVSPAKVEQERYWLLDLQSPLYLTDADAYLARFHKLLHQSITDRHPSGKLGISMSGGLDSATLAAKAVELAGGAASVCADTWVINGEADPELGASQTIASFLGIDHHITEASALNFDPAWQVHPSLSAEPSWFDLYPNARTQVLKRMAHTADVWFFGEGPDNALTFEWRAYFAWLVRNREWFKTALAARDYLVGKSLRDWVGTLRSWSNRIWGKQRSRLDFGWIKASGQPVQEQECRSWRPRALANFNSGIWAPFLEGFERDEFEAGIVWRHPYLETELLEFMLRSPPIPWGRDKTLIRQAMRGRLPEETIHRKKLPLYVDIYGPDSGVKLSVGALPKGGMIEEYVDLSKLPADPKPGDETEAVLRVLILDRWLQSLASSQRL
jgi:asparagine synthase (glutamine-hydrolysing)